MVTALPPTLPSVGHRPNIPPEAAQRSRDGDWSSAAGGTAVATLALAALTIASAAGFARVFSGAGWLLPVFGTAVGSLAVSWVTRRSRLHAVAAAVVDLAAIAMLTIWTVVPSSTRFGLPLAHTWRAVGAALTQLQQSFSATVAPVPVTPGFLLLAVAGTGVVAVLGDWLAIRARSALQGAFPALFLFVVCSAAGTPRGRTWAAPLFVGGVLLHLLAHRVTIGRAGEVYFANRSAGVTRWTIAVGVATSATAVIAALLLAPALAAANGHGVLGWKGEGPGWAGGNREVPSPIVDLQTRLITKSATEVFTVRSPVPSYWRLTSLDQFNGVQWQSTDSYVGVRGHLPGVRPATPGTRQVAQDFHIEALDSIWMPTAFSPEAIDGGGQVSWDPISGSLLGAKATSNGLDYHLTSLQYLSTVTASELASAPSPPADATTAHYLQLPASVPPRVRSLAKAITAGAHTEYAKALALQNYFIDNPAFSYSLEPPSDGYGIDALTTFLFQTKQGYCQQFAGAYAVLARAAGLPTRLAVGFTTGEATGPDTYQVRDADAHTWPEVYFGKAIGWLPFEPTKGGGFSIPGATAYTGNTARSGAGSPQPSTVTTPTTLGSAVAKPPAHTLPSDPSSSPTAAVGVHHGSSRASLLWIGAALVVLLAWLAANGLGRRLRWWRRRNRALGAARVLVAWAEVHELLAWWGCRHRADETPTELAERATRWLKPMLGDHPALALLRHLAAAATAASYGRDEPAPAAIEAAIDDERILEEMLVRAAPRSRHLARFVDPRLAWRSPPMAPEGL